MLIPYKNHLICAFSDTHGLHHDLDFPEDAEILVCAGDNIDGLSNEELQEFLEWYATIPAKLRLFVAGNHEVICEVDPESFKEMLPEGIVWLEDGEYIYEDIKFYSVNARPWLHNPVEIPADVDILM